MEESDQVIMRLLAENDSKNERIKEYDETVEDLRRKYEAALSQISELKDKNFDLLSQLLELEQQILEQRENKTCVCSLNVSQLFFDESRKKYFCCVKYFSPKQKVCICSQKCKLSKIQE
ncbi:hypothetical protein GMAR_ORF135 [Golden Marseillevirus]|uniref:hypothetical protein n=1 Tax=Golden Marseillevirus TaxID=1720526 RepID=UPI000877ADC1|nr:hypothetical protein GMAR_ORF135 [Golden Marseillevirus]ALX27509.1 hypothetical protein GMAR_ORF135 [Golden Marseillevirus]